MQNDFIHWVFYLNYFLFKSKKKKILNKMICLGLCGWIICGWICGIHPYITEIK